MKLAPVQPRASSEAMKSATRATSLSREPELERLQIDELALLLGRRPQGALPLGDDGSWHE